MFRHKHLSILLFACSSMVILVVACTTNSPIQKTNDNLSYPVNGPSPETICKTVVKDPSGVVEVTTGVESSGGPVAILPSETPVTIGSSQKNITQINQPVQGWINSNQVTQVCKPQLTTQQVGELFNQAVNKTISGDYKNAIQDLTNILWSQPDHADAYYKRGIASFNLFYERSEQDSYNYYGASFYDFNQATRLAPGSAEAFLYRGLTTPGLLDKRYADLTEAIRLNPNLAEAYYYRAFTLREDKNGTRKDLDEALRLNPNFAEAYYMRSINSISTFDLSRKDLMQAFRLDPQFTDKFEVNLERGQGFVLLQRKPYPQLLLDKLNQRIQANPQDIDAYFGRGTLKLELADRDGAIADLTQVIQANPQDADAYYSRGLARYRIKDYPSAVADIRQALKLNSKMQEPYTILSLVYYDMGNKSAALENAAQAIQLNSEQIIPYLVRGFIYEEQGNTSQAQADFGLAQQYLPEIGAAGGSAIPQDSDPSRYRRLARALEAQGRKRQAKLYRQQADTVRQVRDKK